MRLFVQYLRVRRTLSAAVTVVLLAALSGLAASWPGLEIPPVLVLTLMPAAIAACISLSMTGPFGELERTAARPLAPLRICRLGGLLLAALLMLAVATTVPDARLVLLRNTVGYAGLTLAVATFVGPAYSWITPLLYSAVAFLGGGHVLWAWPLRPAHHNLAAALAFGLLAIGLGMVALRGTGDRATEMEA